MSSATVNLYRSAASHTVTKAARYSKTSVETYASEPSGAFVITGNRKSFRDGNGIEYTINEGAALVPVTYEGSKAGVRYYRRWLDKRASVFAVPVSALTAEKKKKK